MLLDEIWVHIFDQLPLKDLLQCSLVSWQWFHIINGNPKLRNKMTLKLNSDSISDYIQMADQILRTHSSLVLESIYFYNVTLNHLSSIRHLALEFCFIRSLWNFKRIIENLPNLQTVKFRPTVYETLISTELSLADGQSMATRSLRYFEIYLYPTVDDAVNCWNVMRCFELIPMRLERIHLRLLSVYDKFQEENLKNILNFIDDKYGDSVKNMTIFLSGTYNSQFLYDQMCNFKKIQLNELDLSHPPNKNCKIAASFLQTQQLLEKLRLSTIFPINSMYLGTIGHNLKNLVVLELHSCNIELLNGSICHLTKLKDLELTVIECGAISIPTGLTRLSLSLKRSTESDNSTKLMDLTIAQEMSGMMTLILKNFVMTPDFLTKCVTQMPNLKTCELFTFMDFVTDQMAAYNLSWQHLRKLILPRWMVKTPVLCSIRARWLQTFYIWYFSARRIPDILSGLDHLAETCRCLERIHSLNPFEVRLQREGQRFVEVIPPQSPSIQN